MKRFLLLYFLFCFSFFSFFASGAIDSQDGFQYLAVARNIYYLHEPTAPPYEYNENKNIHMNISQGKDGKWYSITGLGYTLAMIPAVALSDVLHQKFDSAPPIHFPLQSDFSLLLFASFTNIFFASILIVILFAYLLDLGVEKKQAFVWSFLAVAATNLFAYAKNSFAHMMFITFLVWTFYLVRWFAKTRFRPYLIVAGLTYGIVMISYNPTFILPVPALVVYYFLSTKHTISWASLKAVFFDTIAVLLGFLPFVWLYLWYNSIRLGNPLDSGYGIPHAKDAFGSLKVLYEGVWGQLFSPGRSFFLYSPLMVLPIIFWHKLPFKKYFSEFCSFSVLVITFIYVNGIQKTGENWYTWGGESSWGPRYIAVLIPFGIILCALLYPILSRLNKIFILTPLLIASFWVQALGVFLPYQIKFGSLQPKLWINDLEYSVADYGNFIPRFSPLLLMSRKLPLRVLEFPKTVDHGIYNVRFLEGFDFPFFIGNHVPWRGMSPISYARIDNLPTKPVQSLDFEFSNTRLDASSSADIQVAVFLGDNSIGKTIIPLEKWGNIHATLPKNTEYKQLDFRFEQSLIGTSSAKQVLFLKEMSVNGTSVNLGTLDFPLREKLAGKMSGVSYVLPDPSVEDPWFLWRQNSAIYETTFDIWWIRALYYFDYPKKLLVLLPLFLGGVFVSALGMWKINSQPIMSKNRTAKKRRYTR
ncbi:MAG: hypothetical protein ABI758_03400 [Candidatus Woesebacteria bacterium]